MSDLPLAVVGGRLLTRLVDVTSDLAALDHIARLETAPRGVYCGAVGWVDADARRGELNVAIRTFWVEGGQLHLGTGGGITWDSTPEGEWAETELKARRLLRVAAGEPVGSLAR